MMTDKKFEKLTMREYNHMKGIILIMIEMILGVSFIGGAMYQISFAPWEDLWYSIPVLTGLGIYLFFNHKAIDKTIRKDEEETENY